jgi:phosphoglycerate dehydrogenase-like enzyme
VLRGRGVVVARANPASIPIAEFTIMNMIALSRRVIRTHRALAERGDWSTDLKLQRATGVLGGELFGKTLGLVGYGNIGHEIHQRARAFGMTVGAFVRRQHEGTGLDFQCEELAGFLARCDYVVLCLPLTPMTRHLLDAQSIGWMKDGAYLLNISRGPLADEGAVHDALRSGKLAGAALDVWDVEERGEALRGYPSRYAFHDLNVVMTPHYSGATREARERALAAVGRNLRHLIDGAPIENAVDIERGF